MDHFRVALECMSDGIKHARLQYWYFRHFRRAARERDAAFAAYLGQSPRGLHIGAGEFALEHWFNTDAEPAVKGVYYVDCMRQLPFPEHSFDFVFSEHMIEHIPFTSGLKLLAECCRVLKPSGVLRAATPNLRNILALISADDPESHAYLS